jgi:hypothetical protein
MAQKNNKKVRTGRRTQYQPASGKVIPEGDGNRQKVLDMVEEYTNRIERGGIQPHEIGKILRITRQAVHDHLRLLVRKRKVEKRNEKGHRTEYRTTDTHQVSKEGFARRMRPMGGKMIYPIWLKPDIIAKNPIPGYTFLPDANGNVTGSSTGYDYYPSSIYGVTKAEAKFYEKMSREDATVLSKYCQTKFTQIEKKERYMFEFVNRVGAFITYIFIESLKVLSNKSDDNNDNSNTSTTTTAAPNTNTNTNSSIAKLIIDNAIDLHGIFNEFCILFKRESPKEVSKAFRNVYPSAQIVEKYWSDYLQLSRRFKK